MRPLSMNFTMKATSGWDVKHGDFRMVKTVQVDYSTSVISELVQNQLWRAFFSCSPTRCEL